MSAYPGLGRAVVLLLVALVGQAGAGQLLFALAPGASPLLVAGLANTLSLGAVAAWGYGASGEGPSWNSPESAPSALAAGLGLTAVGATVVLGELGNVVALLLPLPAPFVRLFNSLATEHLPVSLFTLVLVAPLTEELLFRGLLLRGFARRWGVGPALFLSSALFAFFHLNVWQGPAAFVAGLYLGWLAVRTGSLWYPIAFHALFNGLPVLLSASGVVIAGYNSPLQSGIVEFQPLWWLAAGAVLLSLGLALSKPWAPLSAPRVSDTVLP